MQVHNLILHGTVRGNIQALGRLVLGATAKVEGDVYYGIIEMTLGAQIWVSWCAWRRRAL